MKILAIESSCDETSASLNINGKVITNIIHSQEEHKKYGGVVPELASREHFEVIEEVVNKSLKGIKREELDIIAVTSGPGLFGGLAVGTSYAKGLALKLKKPIMEINHLEGHILSVKIENKVNYPYISLLLSGGTSQIILVKGVGSYEILSGSLDDAVGEGFDKLAKMLNLQYPGGPIIEKLANLGDENKYKLPISMKSKINKDFSISGLKSAVIRLIKTFKEGEIEYKEACNICASFQKSLLTSVLNKLEQILKSNKELKQVQGLCLTGGVANNKYFLSKLKEVAKKNNLAFYVVSNEYCADNAGMIGNAAYIRYKERKEKSHTSLDFASKPRWPITEVK